MALKLPAGWDLISLDSIDSTNAEAMRRAEAGARTPSWVWARRQTAGRGRQGKTWVSEPGNLYCSALLEMALAPQALTQLSFVAGLAVHSAAHCCLADVSRPLDLTLKWPNDLLLNGNKISGILLESTVRPGGSAVVTVGIGLNVGHSPQAETLPYAAGSLATAGASAGLEEALEHLADAFAHWLAVWNEAAGFEAVRDAWMERAHGLGTQVTVNVPDECLVGRFEGLDYDGAMILETDGGAKRRILAGDLFLAPPSPAWS